MQRTTSGRANELAVNEAEGPVLGVIARRQPINRHQLLRAFQKSPITTPNISKGSLYPLVRRMIDRGLVVSRKGKESSEVETLQLTRRGEKALQLWIKSIALQHTLMHDPLKARAISLGELTREDRIKWIAASKDLLLKKKEELAAYRTLVRLPYGDTVHSADDSSLDAKLQWLDRLLIEVVNEETPQRRAIYSWDVADQKRSRSARK